MASRELHYAAVNVGRNKKTPCAVLAPPPISFASLHLTTPPNFLVLPLSLIAISRCTVRAWISAGLRLCERIMSYILSDLCTFTFSLSFSTHSSFPFLFLFSFSDHASLTTPTFFSHQSHGHDPTLECIFFFPATSNRILSYYLHRPPPSRIVFSTQSDGFVLIHEY